MFVHIYDDSFAEEAVFLIKEKFSPCWLDIWKMNMMADREGFESTTLIDYVSATLLSKFQIGNEQ